MTTATNKTVIAHNGTRLLFRKEHCPELAFHRFLLTSNVLQTCLAAPGVLSWYVLYDIHK